MKYILNNYYAMRQSYLIVFILLLPLLMSSCKHNSNKQINEGKIEGRTYTSQEIGWTINIPKGWTLVSKNKIEANNEKGRKAFEEVVGEYDYSKVKNLLHFKKDKFNSFQSTSEPFELKYEGEWEDNNAGIKELIYTAYENKGIKADTSSTEVTIDGLDFKVFKITLYGPDGNVILYQEMYNRHINGYDFSMNINYNNNKYKETMLEVLRNSKFKKE